MTRDSNHSLFLDIQQSGGVYHSYGSIYSELIPILCRLREKACCFEAFKGSSRVVKSSPMGHMYFHRIIQHSAKY